MSAVLRAKCTGCGHRIEQPIREGETVACAACGRTVVPDGPLDQRCALCQCPEFYRQKDFSRFLGCALMVAAFALVPWTYGLSMPALWCVDMALRRRVPDMIVCYRCRAELRGVAIPESITGFDHFTAMKWERKADRVLRRAEPAAFSSGAEQSAELRE